MKKLIDWRAFLIAMAIVGLISLIANRFFGANFWAAFGLITVGLVVNGLIAVWEDEQPGGFNNPIPRPQDKPDDRKL